MCARYTMVTPVDELIEEFEATSTVDELRPRFNIAPTDQAPIVIQSREGERRLGMARFGLIPHWATEPRQGLKMLNARVETVAVKPAFRAAFARRRCLVCADGWYEWQRVGAKKVPHRFHLPDGRPFAFAGLWSVWTDPAGHRVSSFTILTRAAMGPAVGIHDRMPVVLPREAYPIWLDRSPRPADELLALLEGHRGGAMVATRVSERVGSVRNDDPSLIEPVA